MKNMERVWIGLVVCATIVQAALAQSPRVTVSEGDIVGKTVQFSENQFINKVVDVDLFLGVPFADPPERFSSPTSKTPWQGEWNATEFSPACQQAPGLYPAMSEDCLYLNVYAPSPKPSGVPVMVFIHGGGFSGGSAMVYDFYGVPLVAVGDVIVVAINYRLAVFAQFSTEDEVSPGNYGMLDQVAALKWIHENIEAFGGDKDKITIFGESAGSASVHFHLLSKLSRGYFSQAIMESGTVFSNWAYLDDPDREKESSINLGTALGCDVTTSASLTACLKTKDAEELRAAADQAYLGFYPVTNDGTFLEDDPENLYRTGDFLDVPMLIGFNKDEGTLFPYGYIPEAPFSPTAPQINRTYYESYVNSTLTFYESGGDIVIEAALQEYTDWTIADNPTADFFDSAVNFGGDHDFACPSDKVMRAHANIGGTVYKYFMTHEPSKSYFQYGDLIPSTPWLGAGHTEELTFVFGMPFIDELYNIKGHNMTDDENALSVKFMEFWTNFAKSGDPSKPSLDSEPGTGPNYWPRYTIPELEHKEMSPELAIGRAVRARQCHFWNQYIPSLVEFENSLDPAEAEWRESYTQWKDDMADWQQVFSEYQQQPLCN